MLVQSTIVVALLASFAAAQTANSTIDPTTIPLTQRSQWCQAEISTCGTLCSGESTNNSCIPDTLAYSCICSANNSAPGLQYYKQSLPSFICEAVFANCISAGAGDSAAQAVCNRNEKANCGQLDIANFTAPATTSTTAPSTTANAATGSATGSASSSSSHAGAPTLAPNAKYFGTGALAIGFGAMGLLI